MFFRYFNYQEPPPPPPPPPPDDPPEEEEEEEEEERGEDVIVLEIEDIVFDIEFVNEVALNVEKLFELYHFGGSDTRSLNLSDHLSVTFKTIAYGNISKK